MKGVIFNILEDFVVDGWGEDAYDEILSMCPVSAHGPFVGPGTYPDAELFAIAGAAAKKLGVPLSDALRAFGSFTFPKLAARYPMFLDGAEDAKTFLQSVHSVIHVEVRKLYPQAITPAFQYEDTGSDSLRVLYTSKRKLCQFMEGMIAGVGTHFRENIAVTHSACLLEGADACVFDLRFSSQEQENAA